MLTYKTAAEISGRFRGRPIGVTAKTILTARKAASPRCGGPMGEMSDEPDHQ